MIDYLHKYTICPEMKLIITPFLNIFIIPVYYILQDFIPSEIL